jgi:hypothetical protein
MANARVRGRPIAPLVLSAQERAYLERQVLETVDVAVVDDTFTVNKSHLNEFCERLLSERLSVRFSIFSRADTLNEKQMRILAAAGCLGAPFYRYRTPSFAEKQVAAARFDRAVLETVGDRIIGALKSEKGTTHEIRV